MKSPFKFLDSFTKDDRDIFFGRDREIEELYQRVFDSKLMLVYGVSGTGKSSLIHCGLANKFLDTDWLPIVIRRGGNIIESMIAGIKAASITIQQSKFASPGDFRKGVRSLYLDHYKPVFFIFDQFEELFIFGDKDERKSFIQIVKTLTESDLQCRMIFVMREEYMAGVSEFERVISTFFSNRVRIEKMSHINAMEAIKEPCKVFNISLEEGFAETLLEKLSPDETDVELTYLQVFLDKLFRLAAGFLPPLGGEFKGGSLPPGGEPKGGSALSHGRPDESTEGTSFTLALLSRCGNVSDLLGSFLDEQISMLDKPDTGLAVLKSFVSMKGTKRQMSPGEVSEYAQTLGKPIDGSILQELLQSFIHLRILRDKDQNGRYELRHDALAAKIFEKITMVEKELLEIRQLIENAYHSWQKRGVLLSEEDLQYIAPYEPKLFLPDEFEKLIEKSKYELVKVRHRRRNIFTAAAVVLIIILGGFTFWAVKERKNAIEERIKATSSEKEAIIARDNAIESDRKAIVSEKEAIAARDRAEESELRIKREKELTEIRERQARANNFNYLSKEVVADNPTIALRLAEYALSLDPENKAILSNLNSIYYDNSFYKVFYKFREGNLCQISPDWKKIISTNGRSAVMTDLNGNNPKTLIGHLVYGFPINDVHAFTRRGYDNILSISFSPDGNYVLTGSNDKTARLWDLDGNSLQVFRGHAASISAVAVSPDGKTILTGSGDLTARLWDLRGKCLQIFKGHKNEIRSVTYSPDGNNLLTGSSDSTAILWDLNGNILKQFKGHAGIVREVAFAPDGKTILTGSNDQTARLWDLNGNILQVFTGHSGYVRSVAFSPDGKTILTGSADKTARIWDLNGNIIQTLKGHTGVVNSVVFSPDGKRIITFCTDGISRIWDLSENIYKNFTGHKNVVIKALFSPDGKTILTLSADQTVRFWDLDGNSQQPIKLVSNSIALSPDGKTILTGSLTAQLLDLSCKPLKTFIGHMGVSDVAFSPDGQTILTGSPDKTARLWNLEAKTITIFKGHSDAVTSVRFSPDGKTIITGSRDNTVRLWDLMGNTLQIFNGHNDYITSIAFSPDGKTILTGADDKTARLWDLRGNTIQVFSGHTSYVNSVAFSPDGKSVITGSSDKTARLWDLRGNTLQIFSGYRTAILSVAFSPDGRSVLTGSGDNIARLVNIKIPLDLFIKENVSENLNLKQKLQYEITRIGQVRNEKEINRLFEGLEFCLIKAKLPEISSEKYLEEADILIRKTGSKISGINQGEQFINNSLEFLRLKPQKYLTDRVGEINRMFLSVTSREELKEVYDFYSEKCSNPDSIIFSTKLQESFIQIAERLLPADTSSRKTISVDLAGFSWPLLQNRQFKTSLNAVRLALRADSSNQYLYSTLPLVLVLNNRFDEASGIYLRYYKKAMFNYIYGSYRTIFLADIDELEKRGITHPDFARVRTLLNN
jgi:WD40 repeat protein